MKTRSILLSAILMAAIAPAFAQTTPDMKSMKMHQGMQNMPMHRTAHATGVIQAIDAAKGMVTIKHQAIASIHWPAMTMTFKADPPGLLKSVKVGEKVDFTLHPDGMNSTVTAISRAD
ncbi:MAG TPA: copper-binding protein [Rhodanobacteraceae bacterium]|nr:copper-binding protein [Rhodanobacteraceae bacterium]